jgi:hypothetical protein
VFVQFLLTVPLGFDRAHSFMPVLQYYCFVAWKELSEGSMFR